jgi:glycogen debranching enzyme
MNIDCLEDFASSSNFRYLRRHIIIWGDLVKLRYGKNKTYSPALWKRMKKYLRMMALCFNGFRLDNSHNTPLHVGEYFLRKARKMNQNLHVFAELFTGSPELDALYTKKIGYNALVKETQRVNRER